MKKYILTALAALLCSAVSLLAIPAYPGWIKYTQPDGSIIQIRKVGDEFGHFTLNAAGQYIQQDEDGFYRPMDASAVQARRRAAAVRRQAARHSRQASSHVAVGQKHFLVILVAFKDVAFKSETANADFTALLNEKGYSVNGGTGSARDYYYDNSHGYFEPIFDVYGPVTLQNNVSTYGGNDSMGNDKAPEQAIIEGCKALDPSIDFSRYDNDNDGEVDLVFMYYAGKGEASGGSTNTIWPHQWELSSAGKSLKLDNMKIDKYACTNELEISGMCGIGTACHEFGHAMGLPDFYDTDYEDNGQAAGMFFFSTMDSGAYNNDGRTPPFFTIEERILLGWLPEDSLKEFSASGQITLPTVDDNIAYKTLTDQEGEYFVYECRGANGWDAGLDSHGLIVTHVDKSGRKVKIEGSYITAADLWNDWESSNAINENGSHPCCYVVPAADPSNLLFGFDKYSGSYYFDIYNKGYAQQIPFPCTVDKKLINSYTARSWNGVDADISLSNIVYANDQVSFTVTVPSDDLDYNVIDNPGNGVYSAGDRFSFQLVESPIRVPESVAWYYDDEPVQADSVTLTSGKHTVEAHLTLSNGKRKIVTLEITVN